MAGPTAAIELDSATLRYGERLLWDGLDLRVEPGEFLAVLGPNGSGKTSLLKVLLGLSSLSGGSVTVGGTRPRKGSRLVGYVPQQKAFDADLGARGRDLVELGLQGHRYGLPWRSKAARQCVDEAIASVGASGYADRAVGRLSGGEQQRLRIAQALLGDPQVLLCDEPLLSLDLAHQRGVVELIDKRRRDHATAVVFVTHEINPVLPIVDRVLYLVNGKWAVGAPEDVMTSAILSELYGTQIDVLRVHDRLVVVGANDFAAEHHHIDEVA